MRKDKAKQSRQDADNLFPDLKRTGGSSVGRSENPFQDGPFEAVQRNQDESTIWKENLISLPVGVELPPGYESVSQVREAMERGWRVKWVREGNNELVTEFPEGWAAVRPETGPVELRDSAGIVRGVYGWAEDAELRILPRYRVESQSNSTSGLGSLLVRDRAKGQILERSSNWSAQTGTNHPDWTRLSVWLDLRYPQHRDPFQYWQDCEENSENGVR